LRFSLIFFDFFAQNGPFQPQNRPRFRPQNRPSAEPGSCCPILRRSSSKQVPIRLRSLPRSSLRAGFRLPSSVGGDTGRAGCTQGGAPIFLGRLSAGTRWASE
jgi:hypothetical protein